MEFKQTLLQVQQNSQAKIITGRTKTSNEGSYVIRYLIFN